jgi:tRNA A-37 threonylcarbamoyl transferase component Bud32
MSARGRATVGLTICLCVAAAAGLRAAAGWRGRSAEAGDATKLDARATEMRARLNAALTAQEQTLQTEVVRAAHLQGLRAAVADRVDAATLLDLFDTEEWWAPFKKWDAAIAASEHLVMVRGDKALGLPADLVARAAEAGVGAGVIVGAHPVLAAVAPIAPLHRADPTYLILMSPFDAAALGRDVGASVALSDGRHLLATSDDRQKEALGALVGKEEQARVYDRTGGQLAAAIPASAGLWLWAVQGVPAPARPSPEVGIWIGAAALFALGALLFWSRRSKLAAASSQATPVVAVASGPRDAPVADIAPAPAAFDAGLAAAVPPLTPRTGGPAARSGERVETLLMNDNLLGHRPTEALGSQAAAAPALDQNTFGRYHLLRRLDGGGMADIYTAVLHGVEGFRRVYVIKRLRPELARSRVAVEQFIDEAKLGSMLVHSNIVPVFDFGKVGDEYFMAQEYIIGRDLGRVLARHVETTGRPLPEKLMFYIAHEVLDALGYAHVQPDVTGLPLGIVHRDVSPSNIMVTARGEVKLFDFGIVKATQRVSKTELGVVKGNVSFMSPEQARGQPVDPRSDLFSLGLVIHHSLTNNQLYLGESTFDQLLRAAHGPKTEQLRMLAGLPPTTAAILMRALSVDPNDRYQNAADFAADLAPHVAGGKFEAAALMQTLFGEELRNAAIE